MLDVHYLWPGLPVTRRPFPQLLIIALAFQDAFEPLVLSCQLILPFDPDIRNFFYKFGVEIDNFVSFFLELSERFGIKIAKSEPSAYRKKLRCVLKEFLVAFGELVPGLRGI